MLFHLLTPLADEFIAFNLFRYLTFRTGGALMTALIIAFVLGPWLIEQLRARQGAGQPIREEGPETHFKKRGTPTMGGLMVLIGIVVSTLLWGDLTNAYVWIVLTVTTGFGLIGFGDDYLKLTRRNTKGLPGKLKLAGQIAISGGRRGLVRPDHAGAPCDRAGAAFRQGRADQSRLVPRAVRDLRHRRGVETRST